MKYYGVWNDYGRVVDGLLNEDDINTFCDKYDDEIDGSRAWTVEEDPASSAADIFSLDEAIAEMVEREECVPEDGDAA